MKTLLFLIILLLCTPVVSYARCGKNFRCGKDVTVVVPESNFYKGKLSSPRNCKRNRITVIVVPDSQFRNGTYKPTLQVKDRLYNRPFSRIANN
jgi:hypothetical protein